MGIDGKGRQVISGSSCALAAHGIKSKCPEQMKSSQLQAKNISKSDLICEGSPIGIREEPPAGLNKD